MAPMVPFIPVIISAAAASASIAIQAEGMKQSSSAAKGQRDALRRQEDLAERDQLMDLRRAKAAARAEGAASGTDIFFGSPLDLQSGLEAQAFENFARINTDFDNRIDASRAESDALQLAGIGNILGTATQPLSHLPTFE